MEWQGHPECESFCGCRKETPPLACTALRLHPGLPESHRVSLPHMPQAPREWLHLPRDIPRTPPYAQLSSAQPAARRSSHKRISGAFRPRPSNARHSIDVPRLPASVCSPHPTAKPLQEGRSERMSRYPLILSHQQL